MLLADRSRQHKNPQAMQSYLEQAAAQPRFVEYWEEGSLEIWEAVRAMPVDGEEAAKLELAVMYAMPRLLTWPNAARASSSKPSSNASTPSSISSLSTACRSGTPTRIVAP